jgi:hypothetical protein
LRRTHLELASACNEIPTAKSRCGVAADHEGLLTHGIEQRLATGDRRVRPRRNNEVLGTDCDHRGNDECS